MENKNINYIQILKDAWKITWNNRFLWWFGFFIAIGGGGMSSSNFNFSGDEEEVAPETIEKMNYWWSMYSEWIIIGLIIIFLIAIVFYILNIIGRGGLISSLLRINKGEETSFPLGFKDGKIFFWKIFLLNLVFGLAILLSLAILMFPVARLVYLKAYGAAAILGIIALPIIISIFILAAFLKIYSQIYLVGNSIGIKESVKLSYKVFKNNIKESVLMGLLLMVTGVIIGIGLVMIILVLIIPFLVVGIVVHIVAGTVGSVSVAGIGLLMIIVFSMIWQSAYMVFMQAVWILFFNKIAKVSEEENIKIGEKVKEEVPELGRA